MLMSISKEKIMDDRIARPIILTVLLAALSGVLAYMPSSAGAASTPCSEKQVAQAQRVMRNMASIGTASRRNGHVEFRFHAAYDEMTPLQRKLVTEWYASADACIHGFAREIHFYRNGKLVGKSDRDLNVEVHY